MDAQDTGMLQCIQIKSNARKTTGGTLYIVYQFIKGKDFLGKHQ